MNGLGALTCIGNSVFLYTSKVICIEKAQMVDMSGALPGHAPAGWLGRTCIGNGGFLYTLRGICIEMAGFVTMTAGTGERVRRAGAGLKGGEFETFAMGTAAQPVVAADSMGWLA